MESGANPERARRREEEKDSGRSAATDRKAIGIKPRRQPDALQAGILAPNEPFSRCRYCGLALYIAKIWAKPNKRKGNKYEKNKHF